MALGAAIGAVLGATTGFAIGEAPDRFRTGMDSFGERVTPLLKKIIEEMRREKAAADTAEAPAKKTPLYAWVAVQKDKREHVFDTTQFPADSLCREIRVGPPDGTTILKSGTCKGTCADCASLAKDLGIEPDRGPMAAKPKKRATAERKHPRRPPPPPPTPASPPEPPPIHHR